MKQINLEEILKKELIPIVFAHSPEMTFNATIIAMKEAIRQTLELAAENAVTYIETNNSDFSEDWCEYVDKQSILNTINQVK